MKSNKVRMNISREMHEWFTAIDGKTNDERMKLLKDIVDNNCELATELAKTKGSLNWHKVAIDVYRNKNRILKSLLELSLMVSIILVGYLAYVQGWFL